MFLMSSRTEWIIDKLASGNVDATWVPAKHLARVG
jgi:hypothetical protein